MRNWKKLGLATLLALAVAPAPAAEPNSDQLKSDAREIQKHLKEISRQLADLQAAQNLLIQTSGVSSDRIRRLERRLDRLEQDTTARREARAYTPGDAIPPAEMTDIMRRLDQIEQTLGRMQAARREARAFTPDEAPVPPPTGTIFLRNNSGRRVTVFINRSAYSVPPGETREIRAMPMAPFTYRVDADGRTIRGPVTREFDGSRVFTVIVDDVPVMTPEVVVVGP